jgi:hypothetical protein
MAGLHQVLWAVILIVSRYPCHCLPPGLPGGFYLLSDDQAGGGGGGPPETEGCLPYICYDRLAMVICKLESAISHSGESTISSMHETS